MKKILLWIAFICFVLAALGIVAPFINLVALGLALWVLSGLLPV